MFLSIDFWSTLSIAVAWRVLIDTSLVDLRIVCESAGSFFEEPLNPLFIVVLGTKMYIPETEENILSVFLTIVKPRLNLTKQDLMVIKAPQRRQIHITQITLRSDL